MHHHEDPAIPWGEKAWVTLLRMAPLHAYTKLLLLMGSIPVPVLLRRPIFGRIAQRMGIDLTQAEHSLEEYSTFQKIFIRRLQIGLRPIHPDQNAVISPVDGCLTAFGGITDGLLIQAKGIHYALADLVGRSEMAAHFNGGSFFTLYLRPKDYHRIHCPFPARLLGMHAIPGSLYPVKPYMIRQVQGLLAQNERLVLLLESAAGKIGMVCVAAAGVGTVRPSFRQEASTAQPDWWAKGSELATFQLGSTVVVLFEAGKIVFDDLELGQEVLMGEILAKVSTSNATTT